MTKDIGRHENGSNQDVGSNKWANIIFAGLASTVVVATVELPIAWAAGTSCSMMPHLMSNFVQQHVQYHEISPEIQTRAVKLFIQNLDPTKTSLLKSDVAALSNRLANIFDQMKKSDCAGLNAAVGLVAKRTLETGAKAREILGNGFAIDDSTELMLDAKKRDFAKSEVERTELLRKSLQFLVANSLQLGQTLSEAKANAQRRYDLAARRMKGKSTQEIYDHFLDAFALALDPHTNFLSKSAFDEFQVNSQLALEGIGASLRSHDGYTVIEDLMPGGGAALSGKLRPKDKIIAVAQEGQPPVSIMDYELKDAVNLIRGKRGSTVTLTIFRQAEVNETFSVKIKREAVDLKQQASKLTFVTHNVGGKHAKIGVISIPSFYGAAEKGGGRSTSDDVKELLSEVKKEKADAIVLDMTSNGGGLLDQAAKTAALFLPKTGVVAIQGRAGVVEVIENKEADDEIFYKGPIVVVTTRFSASAAEILAGALQDHRRALVVGSDHTYGKGSVQTVTSLAYFGAIKVTTGRYFLPSGQSVQKQGVPSDVVLPFLYDPSTVGEMYLPFVLDAKPIESFLPKSSSTDPKTLAWKLPEGKAVKDLVKRSKARIAASKSFQEIRLSVDRALQRGGAARVSDLRHPASAAEREQNKSEDGSIQAAFKLYVSEGANVAADLVTLAKSK